MTIDMDKIRAQRKAGFSSAKATENFKISDMVDDMESINDQMKADYPMISESLFIKTYLPAFFGAGESVEDNHATYLSWIVEIASSYNMPVHVCDDRTKEILFTVPAISNFSIINTAKVETKDIIETVTLVNDARHFQPHNWEALLQSGLHGIFKKVYDSNKAYNSDQEIWIQIFTRYRDLLKTMKQLEVPNGFQINAAQKAVVKKPIESNYVEIDDPV